MDHSDAVVWTKTPKVKFMCADIADNMTFERL